MRLAAGGRVRVVAVRPAAAGVAVSVDGRVIPLEVLGAGAGFVLARNGRREAFHCVRDGDVVHLHWRGRAYELRVEREGARAAQRHAAGGLEAPMPGKVIKLSVAPGQRVRKGDEVMVVEAMKMENQLRAPRDGRVLRLAVRVGDSVAPGVVLAEIE